jgi:hypothetical protein
MALRYYPLSRIKTNLITNGKEFFLDDKPYSGRYYETYDGKQFSGASPLDGKSKLLTRKKDYSLFPALSNMISRKLIDTLELNTDASKQLGLASRQQYKPTSYFPVPTSDDYKKGYFIRYFCKKVNENGYIIEVSEAEWNGISNGTVPYDISPYQIEKLFWKITGPLKTVRISQYDIRMGIEDNNKTKTEELNKTFLGIIDFIGGDYAQFAKITS